ncbi:MAG: DHH family phosphoesterase [Methylococcales bacterium]|nr:DHH family phosphoesterase [Methylococcales bacterium]
MHIDVFNGDADGICSLLQLRLDQPVKSKLITGIKREIELLKQVNAQNGDIVTVLDISLKKNRSSLDNLLTKGASILYFDHHETGDIPSHPKLTTFIDTSSNTCTSLLVDNYLAGKYRDWAITAACGDNLLLIAEKLAQQSNLTNHQYDQLKSLGICINYNSYGNELSDLHFEPDYLFLYLLNYKSPFDFIDDNSLIYQKLLTGYADDMAKASLTKPIYQTSTISVTILPDESWARRISEVFSNQLANKYPERAHAMITCNKNVGYQVSVRAPIIRPIGADELCASFTSGGGRKNAAGINHLQQDELNLFIEAFSTKYN